jgi:hypothetical protein
MINTKFIETARKIHGSSKNYVRNNFAFAA